MHTTRKSNFLLGIILASSPSFAQSLPFGLKPVDQVSRSSDSAESVFKEFEGKYTFTAQGIDHDSHKVALAGAFIADGKGHITKGEEDFNSVGKTLTSLSLEGSYTLDTHHAGTLVLKTSDGTTQNFSFFLTPGNSKSASLVADDSVFGVHGTLEKQLFLPSIEGNYNFNLDGETPDADVMTLAGTFTIANPVVKDSINGSAAIYAHFDKDDPTFIPSSPFRGALIQRPDELGRFEISIALSSDGPAASFAAYVADGLHLDLLSIDKVAEDTPSLSGQAVR
jgi:hypothetical protein